MYCKINFKNVVIKISLILIVCFNITYCSLFDKKVSFKTKNYSFNSIVISIKKSFPWEKIAKRSQNNRIFYSDYFIYRSGKFERYNFTNNVRMFAIVKVLGDLRPYTVEVEVVVQMAKIKNNQGEWSKFVNIGTNHSIAKNISYQINRWLVLSTSDTNVVDDFRAF